MTEYDLSDREKLALTAIPHRDLQQYATGLSNKRWHDLAAIVRLIRPNQRVLGRFRILGSGGDVRTPTYCPAPSKHRNGVYSDPFYYYYYDYMSYTLIDSMRRRLDH